MHEAGCPFQTARLSRGMVLSSMPRCHQLLILLRHKDPSALVQA